MKRASREVARVAQLKLCEILGRESSPWSQGLLMQGPAFGVRYLRRTSILTAYKQT